MPFKDANGLEAPTGFNIGGQFATATEVPTLAGATLGQFNTVGAAVAGLLRVSDKSGADQTKFSFDDHADQLIGYEDYVGNFSYAQTLGDVAEIKKQIDQEELAMSVIAENGVNGILAMLAAGTLDPINLAGGIAFGPRVFAAGTMSVRARRLAEALAVTGAADTVLQTQLELMTVEESAANLAGGMFLAGILPVGIFHRLKKAGKVDQFEADMTVPPGGDPPIGRMTGGGDDVPEGERFRMTPFPGQRAISKISAPTRILSNSPDELTRQRMTEIFEFGMDIPDAEGAAVETLMKLDSAKGTNAIRDVSRLWRKHIGDPNWATSSLTGHSFKQLATRSKQALQGAAQRLGAPEVEGLTYRQFAEEVGRALRRTDGPTPTGNAALYPEIDLAAARVRKYLDEMGKRGVESGLLDKLLKGYTPRVYNIDALTAAEDEWIELVSGEFMRKHADLDLEDAVRLSKQARKNIINDPHNGAEFDGLRDSSSPDPVRGRRITIPDSVLDGSAGGTNFLIDNIEVTLAGYDRRMIPELNIMERFGKRSDDLQKEMRRGLTDRHEARSLELPDGPEKVKLQVQFEQDLSDITVGIDRLANRYRLPGSPTGISMGASRFFRALRGHNTATKGGGFVISSFTDIGKPLIVHGMNRVWGSGIKSFASPEAWAHIKATQVESDLYGTGAEFWNAVSPFAVHDADAARVVSRLERGISNAVTGVLASTGFANWNLGMKHFAAHVSQGRLVDVSKRIVAGEALTESDRLFMSRLNISKTQAKKFAKAFDQHGETIDGAPMSNVGEWVDLKSQRQFMAAVRKDVDTIIVTPSIADLPNAMLREGPLRTMLQFKSFSIASMSRTMAPALQNPDVEMLTGLGLMVTMGGVVYVSKELLKDEGQRFKHTDPVSLVYEAIDRSGAFGPLTDINNTMQRLSGNRISIQRMLGSSGYGTRATRPNALGTLLGPGVDTVQSVSVAGAALIDRALLGEPMTRYEEGQLRRLVWGQNIWWSRLVMGTAADALKGSQ